MHHKNGMRGFLSASALTFCILLCSCSVADTGLSLYTTGKYEPKENVINILSTDRSYVETEKTTVETATDPPVVIVTGTPAKTEQTQPAAVKPKEYFMVKFVDSDGYTALSVQTVEKGKNAVAPTVPEKKGDLIFRGWNKEYTNIQRGTVISAIYEREWYTVNFYDIDGKLLKTEQVRWGEDAVPPHVNDREGYLFDGWNTMFDNVRTDLSIFATYYAIPVRKGTNLSDAYSFMPVSSNIDNLPVTSYSRQNYTDAFVIGGKTVRTDNMLYGSFFDMISIGDFKFKSLEGELCFIGKEPDEDGAYGIRLIIFCDGKETFRCDIDEADTLKSFKIPLTGIEKIHIMLDVIQGGNVVYDCTDFLGGILNAKFYED